jgi:hypothetical protein
MSVRFIILDALLVVVGIPCSYLASRRFSGVYYEGHYGRELPKKASLFFSVGLWLGALAVAILVELFPGVWWLIMIVFAISLYVGIAFVITRRRQSTG